MATLERLLISGIRAFPPADESGEGGDEDEGGGSGANSIDFRNAPLTIVQGANGCGKTTIIECLKFGLTGTVPPGSSAGQSFVHDPRVAGRTEVKGQVKILMRSGDRRVLVSRSARCAVKKGNKLEYKLLDSTIKIRQGKETKSATNKCADVDQLMQTLMGTSTAIMESVIFCHQEDSLWPMQESSVLKKKFDDIFESARYNKALEEVKKQRKRMMEDAKTHKAEWMRLSVHKANHVKLEDEQSKLLEQLAALKKLEQALLEERAALDKRKVAAEEQLQATTRLSNEGVRQGLVLKQCRADVKQKMVDFERAYGVEEKARMLDAALPDLEGQLERVATMIARSDETAGTVAHDVRKTEGELASTTKQREHLERQENELHVEKAGLLERKRQLGEMEASLLRRLSALVKRNAVLLPEAARASKLPERLHAAVSRELLLPASGSVAASGAPGAAAGAAGLDDAQLEAGARAQLVTEALDAMTAAVRASEEDLAARKAADDAQLEAARALHSKASAAAEVSKQALGKAEGELAGQEQALVRLADELRALNEHAKSAAQIASLEGDLAERRRERAELEEAHKAEMARLEQAKEANRRESDDNQARISDLEAQLGKMESNQQFLAQFNDLTATQLPRWLAAQDERAKDLEDACAALKQAAAALDAGDAGAPGAGNPARPLVPAALGLSLKAGRLQELTQEARSAAQPAATVNRALCDSLAGQAELVGELQEGLAALQVAAELAAKGKLLRAAEDELTKQDALRVRLVEQQEQATLEVNRLKDAHTKLPPLARAEYDKWVEARTGQPFEAAQARRELERAVDTALEEAELASTRKTLFKTNLRSMLSEREGNRRAQQEGLPTHCPCCMRAMDAEYLNDPTILFRRKVQEQFEKLFDRRPGEARARLKLPVSFRDEPRTAAPGGGQQHKAAAQALELAFPASAELQGADVLIALLAFELQESTESVDQARARQQLADRREQLAAFEVVARSLAARDAARARLQQLQADVDASAQRKDEARLLCERLAQRLALLNAAKAKVERAVQVAAALAQGFEESARLVGQVQSSAALLGLPAGPGFEGASHALAASADAGPGAGPGAGGASNPLEGLRAQLRSALQLSKELQAAREGLLDTSGRLQSKSRELDASIERVTRELNRLREGAAKFTATCERQAEAQARRNEALKAKERAAEAHSAAKRKLDNYAGDLQTAQDNRGGTGGLAAQQAALAENRKDLALAQSDRDRLRASTAGAGAGGGSVERELLLREEKVAALCSSAATLRQTEAKLRTHLDVLGRQEQAAQADRAMLVTATAALEALRASRIAHERLTQLNAEVEAGGREQARAEQAAAAERLEQLGRELAKLEGKQGALKERGTVLGKELALPDYVDIHKRHVTEGVQYRTHALAAEDLDKYYTALDTALMTFHKQKIDEINKNIAQIWPVMYRGGDIDSVSIQSDKSETAKSRTFNYHVVMTKGDTPLDMRGRCSAGQKVMASLVIRMALAETFSAKCGVLALDEPTTNLDAANRDGLAQGLAELLKQYAKMQLIVITHDMDFVKELMAKSEAVNANVNTYSVSRYQNNKGRFVSTIHKESDW